MVPEVERDRIIFHFPFSIFHFSFSIYQEPSILSAAQLLSRLHPSGGK
jgi:hypothetical protein